MKTAHKFQIAILATCLCLGFVGCSGAKEEEAPSVAQIDKSLEGLPAPTGPEPAAMGGPKKGIK